MILIDDCKYSCMECIRGHRSSLCRHHFRPLLQVRSKGRPNVNSTGNPNHRIAVFAEEIEDEVVEKSLKRTPVVIVKASAKQVIDLISGQIIGPYKESDYAPDPNSRPPPPIISSDSFINTSVCCSGNTITKKDKSCGCCTNKSRNKFNKSKILKTYLKKRMTSSFINPEQVENNDLKNNEIEQGEGNINQQAEGNTNQQAEGSINQQAEGNITQQVEGNINQQDTNIIKLEQVPQITKFGEGFQKQNDTKPSPESKALYDLVSVPSCSIPGSCCCDDSCSCKGCMVHGNSTLPINEANKMFPNYFEQSYLEEYVPSEDNIVFNSLGYNQIQRKDEVSLPPVSEPNTANFFASLLAEQSQQVSAMSSTPSEETDSPNSNMCTCSAAECDCYNCETHGIINGCKLEEYFLSTIDNKLMSMISEYSNTQLTRPLIEQNKYPQPNQQVTQQLFPHPNQQVTQQLFQHPNQQLPQQAFQQPNQQLVPPVSIPVSHQRNSPRLPSGFSMHSEFQPPKLETQPNPKPTKSCCKKNISLV